MTAAPRDATAADAGARAAAVHATSAARLWDDLADAGAVTRDDARARFEWECFALFACVRGLVAASGFAADTVRAIDALQSGVFASWDAGGAPADARVTLAQRYNEYETIAQAGGAAGAQDVAHRLGAAAAAHVAGPGAADDLAELLGSLHEAIAEAVVAVLAGDADAPDGATDVVIATPPLDHALEVIGRLERAGLECAVGGSGLLAALGLARVVRDWDVTTDAPRADVEAAVAGLAWDHKGSDALHADEKLMFPALELEIIRGFAFVVPGGIVRVPTRVSRRWRGLPIGSPECWAVAYALLGRDAKRDALFAWLERHGADAAAIAALLAQPLPASLAERLAALPARAR